MITDPRKEFYKNYALSNGKMHIFRFVNTNFGSKWAGLWNMDKKLLDYWAYNVNGKWLSMENCYEFEHEFWCANHKHSIDELKIREEVIPIDGGFISLLKIRNHGDREKEINIKLEVGVNTRHRGENTHDAKYEIKTVRDLVLVKSKKGKVYFGSISGNFKECPDYNQHNPGEYSAYCGYVTENGVSGTWSECTQSKFVPGSYEVKISLKPNEEKDVPFFFSKNKITGRKKYKDWIEKSREEYKDVRESMENFEYSTYLDMALSSLYSFRTEKGFLAGYPFFNEIWVRDACWCIPAYLYMGLFSEVKEFLQTVGKNVKDGKVPGLINSKKSLYNASDSSPLWIISLYNYLDFSGDTSFSKSSVNTVKKVLDYGMSRIDEDIITGSGFSWMDTMNRDRPIEIQAMWSRAFYCGGMILHMNGRKADKYFRTSSAILEKMGKVYWNGKIRDNLGEDFNSPNFVFQLALMHINKKIDGSLSRLMKKDYLTPVGIRSRPSSDKKYNPKGYHTGCVWPFITMSAALANCNYENTENVKMLMDINIANFDKQCVNGINEIFGGDDYRPLGCTSQAWSVAGIITVLDNYFLGITPKLTENMIIIDPSNFSFKQFKRKMRIGRRNALFLYKRRDNKIELEVENLPVQGKIPNIYKSCIVNGERVSNSVAVLEPKKKYSIVLEL